MNHLIGKSVIFQTKRKNKTNNSFSPLFPEHAFSATIKQISGDYILISHIKLLFSESEYIGKSQNKNILIARDKLCCKIPSLNIADTCLIKITNNFYFDVFIYNPNIDLLKSIKNREWFPKLYNICFYNLSSMDMNFARTILNNY